MELCSTLWSGWYRFNLLNHGILYKFDMKPANKQDFEKKHPVREDSELGKHVISRFFCSLFRWFQWSPIPVDLHVAIHFATGRSWAIRIGTRPGSRDPQCHPSIWHTSHRRERGWKETPCTSWWALSSPLWLKVFCFSTLHQHRNCGHNKPDQNMMIHNVLWLLYMQTAAM